MNKRKWILYEIKLITTLYTLQLITTLYTLHIMHLPNGLANNNSIPQFLHWCYRWYRWHSSAHVCWHSLINSMLHSRTPTPQTQPRWQIKVQIKIISHNALSSPYFLDPGHLSNTIKNTGHISKIFILMLKIGLWIQSITLGLRKDVPKQSHSFIVFGMFVLWFSWYAFNAGPTISMGRVQWLIEQYLAFKICSTSWQVLLLF